MGILSALGFAKEPQPTIVAQEDVPAVTAMPAAPSPDAKLVDMSPSAVEKQPAKEAAPTMPGSSFWATDVPLTGGTPNVAKTGTLPVIVQVEGTPATATLESPIQPDGTLTVPASKVSGMSMVDVTGPMNTIEPLTPASTVTETADILSTPPSLVETDAEPANELQGVTFQLTDPDIRTVDTEIPGNASALELGEKRAALDATEIPVQIVTPVEEAVVNPVLTTELVEPASEVVTAAEDTAEVTPEPIAEEVVEAPVEVEKTPEVTATSVVELFKRQQTRYTELEQKLLANQEAIKVARKTDTDLQKALEARIASHDAKDEKINETLGKVRVRLEQLAIKIKDAEANQGDLDELMLAADSTAVTDETPEVKVSDVVGPDTAVEAVATNNTAFSA